MELELIADFHSNTTEGPLWHPLEQRLYWVDIPAGNLFRYDPISGKSDTFNVGAALGGFTVQADGALLLFMARGAVKRLYEGKLTTVIEDIAEERDGRFNDVFTDTRGRVFCGTMPIGNKLGCLYRLDVNGVLTKVLSDIFVSNGMAFTPDRTQLYYSESGVRTVWLLDYNEATGTLLNKRPFAKNHERDGVCDGLTVDAQGYVWVAHWGGGCVIKYSPRGEEVGRIFLPAQKVSSVTFGGADYADMYVTCAGGDSKHTDGAGAGALFRIRGVAQGLPDFTSHVLV